MAKSLILGNGELFVGFDRFGQVQDLHFPYVGLENHVALNHTHRLGVFSEGQFRWFDDPSWKITITCSDDFVGEITAVNHELEVELKFTDIVYNEKNILVREVHVHNLRKDRAEREIKVFFGQQFQISESKRGDTAYFDPRPSALIHYKGRRAFLINARVGRKPFSEYSIGLFDIEGREGTFRDAEDGVLANNAIEHSSVDSVIGVTVSVRGGAIKCFHYWLTVGKSIKEVQDLNAYVLDRSPVHLIRTTSDFWHAWVNRQNFSFYGLDKEVVRLFKQSLFVIRAHADNRGAIIASGDSDMLQHGRDTYHYMWPRDGARSATALDRAGDFNVAQRFFTFCNNIISEEGYFMHKYLPNGALGSSWHPWLRNGKIELPIQQDETALVLCVLWRHYELTRDLEFIETIYNSLILKAAEFLTTYTYKDTNLPYPSYDLWEEKYGISTFTCGATYCALSAAASFAGLLGKREAALRYHDAAKKLREAILKHLYNPGREMFYKMITIENGRMKFDPTLDMSSFYGIFNFDVLPIDDERVKKSAATIEKHLKLQDGTSGVPRYEGDNYLRMSGQPNPWILTTLWLAQYYIKAARTEAELEPAKQWLSWVVKYALPSGVIPEQLDPTTGEPVGATPLVWSHAEFVVTVTRYLNKLEELGVCKACNPVG